MLTSKFKQILNNWYSANARILPWVGEKDPYLIWLSEIILQQTRVEHGITYYQKFKERFPNIQHLADEKESAILKMWEGLGYYSRARNLYATAKEIASIYQGRFPADISKLLKLKGIGNYTAAAIASFAYNLPYAVVDANVIRIIARIFGVIEDIASVEGRQKFNQIAQKILDKKNPAIYNQAIMDFGALICKPVSPNCNICPYKKGCYAFNHESIELLPVRSIKNARKKRFFHYFVLMHKNKILIQQRIEKDIWRNLYQFPVIETNEIISYKSCSGVKEFKQYFKGQKMKLIFESHTYKQQLTHQEINAKFFILEVEDLKFPGIANARIIMKKNIIEYIFPGIIRKNLKELQYF